MSDQPTSSSQNRPVSEFDAWAEIYVRHGAFNHPSELHGSLTGQLAAGERLSPEAWLALAGDHLATEQVAEYQQEDAGLRRFLMTAYERALQSLQAPDMSFQLLLPDEDHAISERLRALSAWVRGFLEGMALSGGSQLRNAPDDIRELIRDFVAISQVEPQEEGSDEDERQLLEIVEFVRVGVLTVYTEFNAPVGSATLH